MKKQKKLARLAMPLVVALSSAFSPCTTRAFSVSPPLALRKFAQQRCREQSHVHKSFGPDKIRIFTRQHSSLDKNNSPEARTLAYETFSLLARQGRSWRRLGHLVDMAIGNPTSSIRTIADVGTDHGLLAMGLALSGRFDKVLGIDVSEQALQNGAISLLENVLTNVNDRNKTMSGIIKEETSLENLIEFRVGNGLSAAKNGEADAVCIAGMGVHTMIKIIQQASKEGVSDAERVGCQQLLLQPTNTRPRNLIMLYDFLQESGWRVAEERIEKLSSRWYISTSFIKGDLLQQHAGEEYNVAQLPCFKLLELDGSNPMRAVFDDYKRHQIDWLKDDAKASGVMFEDDKRWLAVFGEQDEREENSTQ
jgi:tRNA A22 N-methylase